ncbi:hypothetical protein QTJ16_001052 [Diplocarpon rosae]|uniref:Glucose receptor Git3 N-terminal domain-containing protein n=1 Tax=Diplocarpon rosae TaxID=946125 RepID=A0AAD9T7E6_9HELO|nr:hypothetical protein QTJ16_001052 [Diplocarpon rosae]
MTLFADSSTLTPLPAVLSHGLVAISSFALISFLCSSFLSIYLTYRLISWHVHAEIKSSPNQFLLLIYNLLLADVIQALAFLLNATALQKNGIFVHTPTCSAQGWLISTGDLASSVFTCAIAAHTFASVVKDYRLPAGKFYSCIAGAWVFFYTMGSLGPLIHGRDFYVRANAWCWINEEYPQERLWLHYVWICLAMLLTITIYLSIFIFLISVPNSYSAHKHRTELSHHGATPLMILYPLIYTICTAPLAAGRIFSIAGGDVTLGYFVVAGAMISCNGWLDVLLYVSTRRDIVLSEDPPSPNTGLDTFIFFGMVEGGMGNEITIEASAPKCRNWCFWGPDRRKTDEEQMMGFTEMEVKDEVMLTVTVSVDTVLASPAPVKCKMESMDHDRASLRNWESAEHFMGGNCFETWAQV